MEQALFLARDLIHGPLPPATALLPSLEEAIEALASAVHNAGHQWITVRAAHELLCAYLEALPIIAKGRNLGLRENGTYLPTFSQGGNYSPEEQCSIEEIRRRHCTP